MSNLLAEEIVRYRGDSSPDVIYDYDKATGQPRDITGYAYKLTITTIKDPPDNTTDLLSITGDVTDALAGEVQFPWTAVLADQVPGVYWYDIQRTNDLNQIQTIAKNRYIIRQDNTK